MSFRKLLKEEGWYLSEEGLEILGYTEDSTDVRDAVKKILNYDLREIGAYGFPEEYCKTGSRSETLTSPVCVQLQKVRNISAPKINEESRTAPRMLKLIFTDGVTSYQAVEVEYISGLSVNTPPGTKMQILAGCVNAAHNILFLGPANIKMLGGHVTHMVEKWELNRRLAKHTRGGGENSPPPWIPFGQPLEGVGPHDKSFKSLQEGPKLDNVEFETQRKGAIAEAQKLSGVKKVFGGGTKPMLDANVQKIVDAGFSEEQAENILKVTRNNADRALKILQKKENAVENKKEKSKQTQESKGTRKGRGKEGVEGGVTPVKPSGKVSLFDFLEDKLPAIPEPEKPVKPEPQVHHREDNKRGRGGGGGGGGGRGGGYNRGGGAGGRQSNYHNNYNKHDNTNTAPAYHHHNNEGPAKREERTAHAHPNMQPEKAPRFQKKYENEARRHQHQQHQNINMHQHDNNVQSTYQGGYSGQTNYYNSDRRGVNSSDGNHTNTANSRTFYGQQAGMDNLADATAAMNLQHQAQQQTQSRVYNNSRPAGVGQQPQPQPQPQVYPSNSNYNNYPTKPPPVYNNQNMYNSDTNNQYINTNKQNMPQMQLSNGQQQMHQSFYASYPDNQVKMQPEPMRQPELDPYRQNPLQDQRNSYNNRGNGFYQNNKMMTYPTPNVTEQPRKMGKEVGEINWNIGDRCLAKYWEDNGFYDAEITGISARTVVVRFLAYGNYEEVLKTDCLPPSTPVPLHNYAANPNQMMREQSRPARFHQPMYVPPAQRKA